MDSQIFISSKEIQCFWISCRTHRFFCSKMVFLCYYCGPQSFVGFVYCKMLLLSVRRAYSSSNLKNFRGGSLWNAIWKHRIKMLSCFVMVLSLAWSKFRAYLLLVENSNLVRRRELPPRFAYHCPICLMGIGLGGRVKRRYMYVSPHGVFVLLLSICLSPTIPFFAIFSSFLSKKYGNFLKYTAFLFLTTSHFTQRFFVFRYF